VNTAPPKSRRLPIGRIAAVVAVLVAGLVLARGQSSPRFRSIGRGLEFGVLRGDPYCRQGSSDIAVLRVNPAEAHVRVRHYSAFGDQPLDIIAWQKRTGATAVFNAGQYYPDLSYMGMLVSGGRALSPRLHPTYKGALVAGPVTGTPRAHVLDLDRQPIDPKHLEWSEVAQSFMLFDAAGTVRVRRSPQIAPRTIVAEDAEHRLLVFTSEGSYTLSDFATLLRAAPLKLTHAMSMDGGDEAQLCVRNDAFHYASFGHWDTRRDSTELIAGVAPLPAVITIGGE
jgi:hypothetical protein